jgi:cytoskeletal protein CcmA (bactofilin family)
MSIDLSRRPATPILPSSTTASTAPAAPIAAAEPAPRESNQMLVGREVSLSGKIAGCNRILVEGKVEATLECTTMDVAAPGTFNGTATVEDAVISGRFEGTLTVRKRLLIRESGQVSGTIRYGQLEVELGGKLAGDIGWQEKP